MNRIMIIVNVCYISWPTHTQTHISNKCIHSCQQTYAKCTQTQYTHYTTHTWRNDCTQECAHTNTHTHTHTQGHVTLTAVVPGFPFMSATKYVWRSTDILSAICRSNCRLFISISSLAPSTRCSNVVTAFWPISLLSCLKVICWVTAVQSRSWGSSSRNWRTCSMLLRLMQSYKDLVLTIKMTSVSVA